MPAHHSLAFRLRTVLLCLLLSLCGFLPAWAEPPVIDLNALPAGPLGQYAQWLQEEGSAPLTLAEARIAFAAGKAIDSQRPVLSFGIGAAPRWLRVRMHNPTSAPLALQLIISPTWIDYLDVYVEQDDELLVSWRDGDTYPRSPGLLPGIGFGHSLTLPPGESQLYLRAQTTDPFVLNLTLTPLADLPATLALSHYHYGLLYGFLLALMAFNLMLFFGLREPGYAYYSFYLAGFIAMSIAYTGHSQALLWPDSPELQRYGIFILMVLYSAFGLIFASRILALEKHAPQVARAVLALSLGGLLLIGLLSVLEQQHLAALFAFSYLTTFTVIMVLLGVFALQFQRARAAYFLGAALIGMLGSAITSLATTGILPFTALTFNAIEIGIMIEATLFALALSSQMRFYQNSRLEAEESARRDPLTGLLNRRGFLEQSRHAFARMERRARPLSVLMLDMDHFKRINDNFGHDAGDQALTEVARVMLRCGRTDDVLARWGGEEFIYLLPDTGVAEASALAERVRQSVAALTLTFAGTPVSFTVSIGIAERRRATPLADVIAQADALLLRAKAEGRNRVLVASV